MSEVSHRLPYQEILRVNAHHLEQNGEMIKIYRTGNVHPKDSAVCRELYESGHVLHEALLLSPDEYRVFLMEGLPSLEDTKWEPFWRYMRRVNAHIPGSQETHTTMDTGEKFTVAVRNRREFLRRYKEYVDDVYNNPFKRAKFNLRPPCITQFRANPDVLSTLTVDIDCKFVLPAGSPNQQLNNLNNQVHKYIQPTHWHQVNEIFTRYLRLHFHKPQLDCFVLRRNPRIVTETSRSGVTTQYIKDGLHMEFPYISQVRAYYEYLFGELAEAVEGVFLRIEGIISPAGKIYDNASYRGNWLMYGSTKPIRKGANITYNDYLDPYEVEEVLNSKRTVVKHARYEAIQRRKASDQDKSRAEYYRNLIDEYDLPSILCVHRHRRTEFRVAFQVPDKAPLPFQRPVQTGLPTATGDIVSKLLRLFEGSQGVQGVPDRPAVHLGNNEWFAIGVALINYYREQGEDPDSHFVAFDQWSQNVRDSSYDARRTENLWNTYRNKDRVEGGITIGTLYSLARRYNPEGYRNLMIQARTPQERGEVEDLIREYTEAIFPANQVFTYHQRYIQNARIARVPGNAAAAQPIVVNPIVAEPAVENPAVAEGVSDICPYVENYPTLVLWSNVNTGKTTTMRRIVENYPGKRILMITFRISLAEKLIGDLRQYGFIAYNEHKGDLSDHDRIIIQLDSLGRVGRRKAQNLGAHLDNAWDFVIVDEINLLLQHLESPLINNYGYILSQLESTVRGARRLVVMDAYITPRVKRFLDNMDRTEPGQMLVLRNTFIPDDQKRKVWSYQSPNEFTQNFIQAVARGLRVTMISMSKDKAETFAHLAKCHTPKVRVYTGETIKFTREDLRDVNSSWADLDVVVYTQTITAGVSYDNQEQLFDTVFMYAIPDTGTWDTVLQMLNRVRQVRNRDVHLYIQDGLSSVSWRPRVRREDYAYPMLEDQIRGDIRLRNNQLYGYVFTTHGFSRQRFRDPEVDWVFWSFIENTRHRLFSNDHFRQVIEYQMLALDCEFVTVRKGDPGTQGSQEAGGDPNNAISFSGVVSDARRLIQEHAVNSLIGAADITDLEETSIKQRSRGGETVTEAESLSCLKQYFKRLYRTDRLVAAHQAVYNHKSAGTFARRCQYFIDPSKKQLYLNAIAESQIDIWSDTVMEREVRGPVGKKSRSAQPREIVPDENVRRLAASNELMGIELYMLASYVKGNNGENIYNLNKHEVDVVVFALTVVHQLGFALNDADMGLYVGQDQLETRMCRVRERILRNYEAYNRAFGKRKSREEFAAFSFISMVDWLNPVLDNTFGVRICKCGTRQKPGPRPAEGQEPEYENFYGLRERDWPYPLYAATDYYTEPETPVQA